MLQVKRKTCFLLGSQRRLATSGLQAWYFILHTYLSTAAPPPPPVAHPHGKSAMCVCDLTCVCVCVRLSVVAGGMKRIEANIKGCLQMGGKEKRGRGGQGEREMHLEQKCSSSCAACHLLSRNIY